MHDGAQQRLVSLALFLRAARAAVMPELGELGAQLDRATAEADGALEELREIARGIHPAILARGGLRMAVKALARRSPVPVALNMRVGGRLPEHVEVSAYYVIAEALTNVAKHARASAVTVELEADAAGTVLRVEVHDDSARRRRFPPRHRPARPEGPRGSARWPDFSASTICSRALAVAPGASVTSFGAVEAVRLAARPICVYGGPETRETPG